MLRNIRGIFRGFCLTTTRFNTMSTDTGPQSAKKMKLDDEKKSRIVWVDLEMSGLDIEREQIIEMACLVTDAQLNIVAEGPNLIINQPDSVMDNMDEWCTKHHGEIRVFDVYIPMDVAPLVDASMLQSGLTEAVKKSDISLQEAERQMLEFVKEHTEVSSAPLAGNSIHVDRMFLQKHMEKFLNHLHYRIIDVSTVKELCRRWYPDDFKNAPKKKFSHRALDDIKDSIEELKYYRSTVFKS